MERCNGVDDGCILDDTCGEKLQSSDKACTVDLETSCLLELPVGMTPLVNQLAGHKFGHNDNKDLFGMLDCQDGTILKPVAARKGTREELIYQLANSKSYCLNEFFSEEAFCSNVFAQLKNLIPEFLGMVTVPQHKGVSYIHMVDITRTFTQPVTIDVKIGKQAWAPDTSEEKIARQRGRCPFLDEICFQVLGARYVDADSGEMITNTMMRRYTPTDLVSKGLFNIFCCFPFQTRRAYISAINSKLKRVEDWFHRQSTLAFYGSSVLIALEGDPSIYACNEHHISSHVEVKMIDFVHVWETWTQDINYIEGISSLQKYFTRLLLMGDLVHQS